MIVTIAMRGTALGVLILTSACGGSNARVPMEMAPQPQPDTQTFAAATFERTVTDGPALSLEDGALGIVQDGFTATIDPSNRAALQGDLLTHAIRRFDPSHQIFTGTQPGVVVGAIGTDRRQPDLLGGVIYRTIETEAPTRGTSTYTGDYGGVISSNARAPGSTDNRLSLRYLVTGDAELTVDFGENEASGSITNRVLYNANTYEVAGSGTSADSIVLFPTEIDDDGSFSIDYSFGALTLDGTQWDRTTGEVTGILAGSQAQSIAGLLISEHTNPDGGFVNPETLVEAGAILATQDN